MAKVETLTWQIDGKFITDLARTWFWDEGKEYEKSEELLLNCMCTDKITLDEKKDYCQKIIEGKLKFVGINTFTLEEDGENVRPITLMLEKQKSKIAINEIEKHMKIYPMNYVDIYSIVKSYERALYEDVKTFEEVIMYFAGQHDYFGKWRQKIDDENYIETIEEYMESSTKCGLWLLDEPELIYNLNKGPLYDDDKDDFFEKLYNYLSSKKNLDYYMKERQNKYAATIRMQKQENEKLKQIIENSSEKMKTEILEKTKSKTYGWKEEERHINEMSLKEYDTYLKIMQSSENYPGCMPDNLESAYGLIAPNGDYYSSSFGGHNIKAYWVMCGLYNQFGFESRMKADMKIDIDKALDFLIEKGWIAIRYLPGKGDYLTYNEIKRATKAQIDKIYDVIIKYENFRINGLKNLEEN